MMSDNLKNCLKISAIVGIAFVLMLTFVPGPILEFLFYALVTICCIVLVILFFMILYGISKSEI